MADHPKFSPGGVWVRNTDNRAFVCLGIISYVDPCRENHAAAVLHNSGSNEYVAAPPAQLWKQFRPT